MPRKKFTVEQAFLDLDEIVEKLEKDDTSLNDALNLYSQGMKLVKKCQDSLDMVEKELMILEEDKAPSSVKDEV
jgi:exodeoxyribonuclease VII small subunit